MDIIGNFTISPMILYNIQADIDSKISVGYICREFYILIDNSVDIYFKKTYVQNTFILISSNDN